jgi:pimeloyl-ACP methyl ester carboxylesterase/DNA-binding CsgD family transcriptional regulator
MDAPPVQYVRTPDGVDIAYCVSGSGRPFVHVPLVFNHIQLQWAYDSGARWLRRLSSRFRLVQYDHRGRGMSSRGIPADLYSEEALVLDLEQVVDALALDGFVLFGAQRPGRTAIAYALKHPERVAALILAGTPWDSGTSMPRALIEDLAAQDWDAFLSTLARGSAENRKAVVERWRQTVTQEDWLNLFLGMRLSDVSLSRNELLGSLRVPTLVIHPRETFWNTEPDSKLAAAIPGAHLVVVDGGDDFVDHGQTLNAIDAFLADLPLPGEHPVEGRAISAVISPREVEVLRLVAAGKSNQQIADQLVLSVNTVIRHVSNIYAKTGAANRAEATAYAARQGLI